MLLPLPRRSDWRYYDAHPFSRISLPRNGHRVGLRIDLFEACSAFTHVAACTLALSPYFVTRLPEGFRHFVTSMPAPVASGWSGCRVGLAPTGKRRLVTAHTISGALGNCRGSRALAGDQSPATQRPAGCQRRHSIPIARHHLSGGLAQRDLLTTGRGATPPRAPTWARRARQSKDSLHCTKPLAR